MPGLLGLAVAVAASRLLPLGCRALYGTASRHGLLAAYLALRHVARRSGGVRTTIVLATAFSLAAFAFAAWSVGQRNYRLVAEAEIGAPEVLTVRLPAGQNLGTIVDRIDPSGRLATAVDTYQGTTRGRPRALRQDRVLAHAAISLAAHRRAAAARRATDRAVRRRIPGDR